MADALQTDDARFRLAMDSAGIGMAIVSLEGSWQEVNPALCRMLGHAGDALVGRDTQAFVHPDDQGVMPPVRQALLAGGGHAAAVELRYRRADGGSIEVLEDLALLRSADGAPMYFIAQLRDVSGQRRAERALQALSDSFEQRVDERTAALEEASRRWESFAYGVSHDLRAPLRAIDGFATHLERHAGPGLDQAGQDSLQRIRGATQRMGGLIDSLLELSRISRAELRPERVDISMLAEWSAAELQDAQPQRRAEVTVQPGLEVIGDERLLKILLTQMLRNAWQFAAKDSHVDVEVKGVRSPEGLQLTVRDRGIGFDMAYAGKLFDPFQRLHGSEEGAGHGIGLSIAQQVVSRHRGRIWAEAVPGQGATFHVTLHDLIETEAAA